MGILIILQKNNDFINRIKKTNKIVVRKIIFIETGVGNPNNIKRMEEFKSRGYDVVVYAFRRNNNNENVPQGIDVNIIGELSSDSSYISRVSTIRNGIKSIVKKHKEDDCVFYLLKNDTAIIYSTVSKHPYIFEEADMTHVNMNKVVGCVLENRIKRIIKRSVLSVFRSEEFLKYHFGENRPNNVYVIPNRLHPGILNIEQKEYSGLDEKHLKFGFVGGIRYDTIYIFAETVLRHFPQHEFHFYGLFPSESLEKQFMPLDKYENCFFHGAFRSPNDLPEIYSKIDVLLSAYDVTSINPRFAEPNKLYEAIYFDKPIIVSSNSFLANKVARLGVGYDVDALSESAVIDLVRTIDKKSITKIKENIAKIDKKTCINCNEDFFNLLERVL